MTRGAETFAAAMARPVREVMHHPIVACQPGTPLAQVARMMGIHRVHAVIVYRDDPDGAARPWGVVCDLDVLGAALAGEGDTASEVVATPLLTVRPEDDVATAARLMVTHAASHVVVVGPGGEPLGVLSSLDMARAIGHRPIDVATPPNEALDGLSRLRL
jgi:CBS domain-containing protein